MKKILFILILLISTFAITSCSSIKKENEPKVVEAILNENGDIIIDEAEITEIATYISYKFEGVTIGFIVVRGTDGKVRIAFNTCQSCNPSPNAYFVQEGKYFVCQNCGNKFYIDEIGEDQGGCNPAPIEEMTEENGIIIISSDYANTYKNKFENWNGPKV